MWYHKGMKWRSWIFIFLIVSVLFVPFSDSIKVYAESSSTTDIVPNAEGGFSLDTPPNKEVVPDSSKCGFFNVPACMSVGLSFLIKNIFLNIAGFFLWASAQLLDYVINVGILGFKSWAPDKLYPLWQVMRQIVSMFVVFSGLYLGFMYIINRGDEFKRYIPWIIIFGLFVNFSYPATRAAIDLSNIVSLNIYASAIGTTQTLDTPFVDSIYNPKATTAGSVIMQSLGLQGLIAAGTKATNDPTAIDKLDSIPAMLLLIGYIFYAAYIFFIASGILILRTLALSFIIIASPILFVDAVIPKLGNQAQKLRKIFFEQLSVSVVFMVMLYLSIAMTKVFSDLGRGAGASGSSIVQIFNVIMMLVLLHIMLKVTKEVSGSVGDAASKWVGKFGGYATGAAIGLATGGTGLLARQTIGAAAARWSQSDSLKNEQGTWFGRRKLDLANSLSNSSFDARNTKAMSVAGTMGGFSKGLAVTGRLKTYDQARKAKEGDVTRRAGLMTNDAARAAYLQKEQDRPLAEFQRFGLGILGPKDAKSDAEITAEKITKGIAKEDKNNLFGYVKATKDEKAEFMKRAGDKQKSLYTTVEEYQAITGETETDIKKKMDILKSFGDDDVAKAIINNDTLVTMTNKENQARVADLQKAYKISLDQAPKEETSAQNTSTQQATAGTKTKTASEEKLGNLDTKQGSETKLDEESKEAFKQQAKAAQDLNDLVKSFVKNNSTATNQPTNIASATQPVNPENPHPPGANQTPGKIAV